MIEQILPSTVAGSTATGRPTGAFLFPEEEAVLARAVEKRRREFSAVRSCARRALATLGLPPTPILPGASGMPCWPDGIVGSMTHCDGYAAAAVATTHDMTTVGIDAEPHQPLPNEVLDLVARPEEKAALRRLASGSPEVCWDRLLFSAKESVYKAWFPVTRRWLGFEEASVELGSEGTFRTRLLAVGSPYSELTGRWLIGDGVVVTAIAVAAAS